MNKIELLERLTYTEILLASMSKDDADNNLWHVEAFYKKHTNVRNALKNAVLIKAIQSTQGASNFFSMNYLDKIYDTFRSHEVTSAAEANKFLENKNNHGFKKNKKEVFVPDWMPEFEEMLKNN